MGLGNKSTRKTAIPYRVLAWEADIYNAIGTGNAVGGIIRFNRPFKGDIIEAKLLLNAVTSTISPTTLAFYKAGFAADGITAEDVAFADRFRIPQQGTYGNQANVFFDDVDLTPLIPRRGDPDFNADAFAIGFELVAKDPLGWILYDFKIDASVQIGVL